MVSILIFFTIIVEIIFDKPVRIQNLLAKCDTNKYKPNDTCKMSLTYFPRHSQTFDLSADSWTKITPKQQNTNILTITSGVMIEDIAILYDSDLDTEGSSNENFGLAKVLEQIIEEMLDKTPMEDE
jgi:hypothetical protein